MSKTAAILAGGRSRRMGGQDKAELVYRSRRLIDCVIARLQPQADMIVISGRGDYGSGLAVIADDPAAPAGPAAGVYSVWRWLARERPQAAGFFTAPVDGPFLPADLLARLGEGEGSSIAADAGGVHPTFAYWTCAALATAFPALMEAQSVSLRALAASCSAREVRWPGRDMFMNINTREDLAAAETR